VHDFSADPDEIDAAGERTAQEIAKELSPRFEQRGRVPEDRFAALAHPIRQVDVVPALHLRPSRFQRIHEASQVILSHFGEWGPVAPEAPVSAAPRSRPAAEDPGRQRRQGTVV